MVWRYLFEIAAGKAQGSPVTVDLRRYPVRVVGLRSEVARDGEA